MKDFKVVLTKDGSKSLYLPELDETYHSHHGALQESQHVYIKSGLDYLIKRGEISEPIRIFEMGFGTGLNAFLTAAFCRKREVNVIYKTIEKYPLPHQYYTDLSYYKLLETEMYEEDCKSIVAAPWEEKVVIHPSFALRKINGDFFDFVGGNGNSDLIYFDAFGHRAQSELWEERAFQICADILRKGGVLVTYASKGSARRNLISVGFEVERIPGAPGKREMMRATKVS